MANPFANVILTMEIHLNVFSTSKLRHECIGQFWKTSFLSAILKTLVPTVQYIYCVISAHASGMYQIREP